MSFFNVEERNNEKLDCFLDSKVLTSVDASYGEAVRFWDLTLVNIVTYRPVAERWLFEKQSLLDNCSVNTFQWKRINISKISELSSGKRLYYNRVGKSWKIGNGVSVRSIQRKTIGGNPINWELVDSCGLAVRGVESQPEKRKLGAWSKWTQAWDGDQFLLKESLSGNSEWQSPKEGSESGKVKNIHC